MAEEIRNVNNVHKQQASETETETMASTDRGIFDFMKKKPQEEAIATEFDHKVQVSSTECNKDEEEEKEHGVGGLLEKLHRSDSSTSGSSDEEERDDEEKKRKKKEKKALKKKKKMEEKKHHHEEEDTNVPIEKCEEKTHDHVEGNQEEKKGLLDKIKEKLPGQHKKADELDVGPITAPTPVAADEKKGFLNKIKEKIPGFHSKNGEE